MVNKQGHGCCTQLGFGHTCMFDPFDQAAALGVYASQWQ
jgi:hypothetical protein